MNNIIKTEKDIKEVLKSCDLDIPIIKMPRIPELTNAEKRKIQLELVQRSKRYPRDGKK